jgi:hypothetical protein
MSELVPEDLRALPAVLLCLCQLPIDQAQFRAEGWLHSLVSALCFSSKNRCPLQLLYDVLTNA